MDEGLYVPYTVPSPLLVHADEVQPSPGLIQGPFWAVFPLTMKEIRYLLWPYIHRTERENGALRIAHSSAMGVMNGERYRFLLPLDVFSDDISRKIPRGSLLSRKNLLKARLREIYDLRNNAGLTLDQMATLADTTASVIEDIEEADFEGDFLLIC